MAGAPGLALAQTGYIPYFGKNQIRYDNFDWHTYQTEHFEIYYYPEIEPHLERIAGYAESAYQHVSSELKHDLSMKLPLILFSTASEFWQQNVIPGQAQEGVGAFAEPGRYRIVMPIDEPPDLLYRLIVHELTHQFQFDIIPTGLIRRNMPLWVFEGMSDYMTGYWRPLDIMTVRDAAVSDIVPKMSEMQDYGGFSNPRLIYNLGHAAFEFMESKWGKEGVRAYVFALRRSVIGGSDDAYQEAFQITPEEWDQQFDRYLKERFKPFRDKERPADYGRDLAPDPRKGKLLERAVDRAVAVGRSDRRHDRQRPRSRIRHRPDLGEGRLDHPQPDERLRSEHGLRVPGDARRPLELGAVDVVVAAGRSPRLLRAHGEGSLADRAERRLEEDRGPHPADDDRRAGVAGLLARRQADRVLGHARQRGRHLHGQPRRPRRSSTSPRTSSRTTRRRGRRTAGRSSISCASAATRSCSAWMRTAPTRCS